MIELVLYMTAHCHLCEQAETLLLNVKEQHNIHWVTQEISDDDLLTEQYGIKIPVLKHVDSQSELNWPFSEKDIVSLIAT